MKCLVVFLIVIVSITLVNTTKKMAEKNTKRRVILDVDAGVDDYLALLIFFDAEKKGQLKIEAIVCTMGNTSLDDVCKNVVRLLELLGRTDIPVFRGATKQLLKPDIEIKSIFGEDGFGDIEHEKEPDLSIIKKVPAAVGMAEIVLNNPNEISLICLGPLTNAALAMRLYENFASSLRDLWIMGGNYSAKGNITPTAEFNFYIDPESVQIVLESVTKPTYILTIEACWQPQNMNFDWRFNVFGKKPNPEIQLMNRAERNATYRRKSPSDTWRSCDGFLAVAFIDPVKYIAKQSIAHASVELRGSRTRGQMVLDHMKTEVPNVMIIEEIDGELFAKLLMDL